MAFHEIDRGSRFSGRGPMRNKVRIYRVGPSQTCLVLSEDINKAIGSPTYLNVLVGAGEHSGYLALVPSATQTHSSYAVAKNNPKSRAVKIGISPKKIGVVTTLLEKGGADLPFEITEDGLIVDLRGLRSKTTSINIRPAINKAAAA